MNSFCDAPPSVTRLVAGCRGGRFRVRTGQRLEAVGDPRDRVTCFLTQKSPPPRDALGTPRRGALRLHYSRRRRTQHGHVHVTV